ncbi:MAG: hypothetical protein KDD70_11645 [Bdellovibrionales bacterium]|nr:hypothetical protein [Bdellovibrionales bacterium]
MSSEESYRRKLIRLVTFLAGVYFFVEFLLPESILKSIGVADIHSDISNGFITVGTMAIGLGIINLFRVHGTRVVFRRKDWFFSAVLLTGLIAMMAVTTADWMVGRLSETENAEFRTLGLFAEVIVSDSSSERSDVPERSYRVDKLIEAAQELGKKSLAESKRLTQELSPALTEITKKEFVDLSGQLGERVGSIESISSAELSSDEALLQFGKILTNTGVTYGKLLKLEYDESYSKKLYLFFFEGLFVALGSAMFSLLGVYIASAAYRAFRVKSIESLLMMSTAIIVMLGQIPFHEYFRFDFVLPWVGPLTFELPGIRQWLMETPNTAAFRAIKIGAAIAGLVMAFRMWFSIESESFSPRDNIKTGGQK